jgi:hypothetical protein
METAQTRVQTSTSLPNITSQESAISCRFRPVSPPLLVIESDSQWLRPILSISSRLVWGDENADFVIDVRLPTDTVHLGVLRALATLKERQTSPCRPRCCRSR